MRKLFATGSAALLALGLAAGVNAQQYHPNLPTAGTSEVDFDANVDFDADLFDVSARYGYFFNRNFQLGPEIRYLDGDDIDKNYEIGVFANWHFPTSSPFLPYVGLFGGYADIANETATSYGAQGGVKYFFNPNVAGFAELNWREREDADASTKLAFGLAIFFGPGRALTGR